MSSTSDENCQFCKAAKSRYTCPKCNAPYCSVTCYKSPTHLNCSEEFYKNCIAEELSTTQRSSREDMHKIYEILKRINDSDEGFNPADFDADGLDDPLDSDDDATPAGAEAGDNESCEATFEEDIATRLKGVDINNSDVVWSRLTAEEQLEFQKLIESGEIMKLLPDYKPWWSKKQNSKIVDLSDKAEKGKDAASKPDICKNIQIFTDICKKLPSPCLHYNLWNILAAYACIVRFFSGEHLNNPSEAAAHLVNLSSTLKYGTNFEDAEDAIISVEMESLTTRNAPVEATGAVATDNILVESREQLQQDARQLMSTRDFKLAALSDILQLLLLAKQQVKIKKTDQADFQKLFALCSGSVELNRAKLQQLAKKMEFFLSYVNRDETNVLQ